jgi:Domain of Unknown Function (DUF326)
MTDTRDVLDAWPIRVPLGSERVAAAIDACLSCVQSCTSCANANLCEAEIDDLRTCIALCINCADVCEMTARILSRPAGWDHFVVYHLLRTCVRTCTSSADECARHAHHHRHCAICEKVCRACLQACSTLLDSEALQGIE